MSRASKNSPIESDVLGEGKKAFRLLSYPEYLRLSGKEKTRYLAMASQELEDRQRKIREQMEQFAKACDD
jgi:hypothetical protein